MIDKRLVLNLSGLNPAAVRHVDYVLHMCSGDSGLSNLFCSSLDILENLVELVSIEIDSCCCDIRYWETILCSTNVEVNVIGYHMAAYRYVRYMCNKFLPEWEWTGTLDQTGNDAASLYAHAKAVANSNPSSPLRAGLTTEEVTLHELIHLKDWSGNADEHLFVLRFGLQRLYCMMASIKEASEHLKRIHTEIAVTTQRSVTLRSKRQNITFTPKMADDMCQFANQNIFYCLRDLLSTIRIYEINCESFQNKSTSLLDYTSSLFLSIYKRCGLRLISDSPPLPNDPSVGFEFKGGGDDALRINVDDVEDNISSSATNGNNSQSRNKCVLNNLQTMFDEVSVNLATFRLASGAYPLQATEVSARRPSRIERVWLRDLLIIGAVLYSSKEIFVMYRSGYLKELVDRSIVSISENVSQHLIEPMKSLSRYLYARMEKSEEIIVTRRELRDSRRDLKDMLDKTLDDIFEKNRSVTDYWDRVKGYIQYTKESLNIIPQMQDLGKDLGVGDFFGGNGESNKAAITETNPASAIVDEKKTIDASNAKPAKPPLKVVSGDSIKEFEIDQSLEAPPFEPDFKQTKIKHGEAIVLKEIADRHAAGQPPRASMDVDNIADEYLDSAMEHVMKKYKEDSKFAIWNLFSGIFINVSLIQMQKVKVMTEAAMLRLDQVLAENQLTMAGAAALPAVVIGASLFSMIYTLFFTNPPTTAAKTLQLRLILAKVERALQEVYKTDIDAEPTPGISNARNIIIPSPSHGSFTTGISPRMVRERHLSMTNIGHFQFPPDDVERDMHVADEGEISPLNELETTAAQRYLADMFPDDEADLYQSVPMVRVNSATAPQGDTFRYVENARLISRGQLSDALLKLRKELINAFTPRYVRWFDYARNFLFETTGRRGRPLHANCSWLTLPIRVMSRLIWGEIQIGTGDREYDAILGDVVKLESPEDEVKGTDKIIVASRMRQSYRCFSMN